MAAPSVKDYLHAHEVDSFSEESISTAQELIEKLYSRSQRVCCVIGNLFVCRTNYVVFFRKLWKQNMLLYLLLSLVNLFYHKMVLITKEYPLNKYYPCLIQGKLILFEFGLYNLNIHCL